MKDVTINIADDYAKTPGGRHIHEGKFSGEDFRETLLKPTVVKAIEQEFKVIVVLDGGFGYAPSFLEEAFGGLIRELKDERILNIISVISEEEPSLIEDIKKYMTEAFKEEK